MPVPTEIHDPPDRVPSEAAFPPLAHFRVNGIPPAAFYVPEFITAAEEEYLIRKVKESPQPKWKTVGTGRRLQYWGGNMSKNGVLLPEVLPDFLTTFPDIIGRIEKFLAQAVGSDGGSNRPNINQVLVNEYHPGQGISPHEDGPAFFPLVATLSLGSHTVLDIHHYLSATSPSPPMTASPATEDSSGRPIAAIPLAHLLLLPRSLLILSGSLYASHLHGISARALDLVVPSDIANLDLLGDSEVVDAIKAGGWMKSRGVRTSLTFRHAQKVVKGDALGKAMAALRR